MGHPLFSDEMYGGRELVRGGSIPKFKQFIQNCLSVMPRQSLHAKELGFIHPKTGEYLQFSADLPDDFSALLKKVEQFSL